MLKELSDKKIVKVSLGVYHAGAITDQGLLFTWGRGINGQLGHGKMQNEVQKNKRIYIYIYTINGSTNKPNISFEFILNSIHFEIIICKDF